MQRWRGLEDLPGNWGRCVVTIGVFDGVHLGHQELIRRTVEVARERDLPSVVLTFDPHPSEVLRPGSHPAQLTTLRRKAELIESLGVDVMCVLPFTLELSRLTADEFVHEILVDRLHAAVVVVGENFTFGAKAAGDITLLRELGRRFGYVAYGAELQGAQVEGGSAAGELLQGEITYSSTYIRSCIDAGDVAAASAALGRPHRLEGIVVRGDGRGNALGYPTANLATPRFAAIPADGVYSCWFNCATHPEQPLPAAVSVGTNPTFSGRERSVEAYVLGVDEDFYGQHVSLDFVARLRDMVGFATTGELVDQIGADVEHTRATLGLA
ncbi:bifunctional riboflavin kinase/FAD synthetase [Haloechinothrix sp. LS1_15]|uniref:bifunctional riboflavin kinase/FAD synthetase n=1 Tax=Haloechinothrix sp. LS1_15 TaxID=2652248 RepID=UPI002946A986|nr:bifunctional riboflavin kinase/FAD synthetase [Haloechinothrix sp. LS1_15]MDV6012143.1 bifunctional riboflavin kinase/FAD synthetase [Haloechinothrix sp. LS1_15]